MFSIPGVRVGGGCEAGTSLTIDEHHYQTLEMVSQYENSGSWHEVFQGVQEQETKAEDL